MDIALWFVQIILAIKLVTTAISHGLGQNKTEMHAALEKVRAHWIVTCVAVLCLIGAIGLILPELLHESSKFTSYSSAAAAILLLVSILCHVKTRKKPKIFVSIILAILAAFVAVFRGLIMIS